MKIFAILVMLEVKYPAFHHYYYDSLGVIYLFLMFLISLRKFQSVPSFLRVFFFFLNHDWVLNFTDALSTSKKMIVCFFPFYLLTW